jgi:hypothetical protein
MKNSWIPVLVCTVMTLGAAAQACANDSASAAAKGKVLVAANGARLGQVYRVESDGAVQMIIGGKLVTVPASTLSSVDGKLTTSLSKNEVLALQ